jgi:hypothetical protein
MKEILEEKYGGMGLFYRRDEESREQRSVSRKRSTTKATKDTKESAKGGEQRTGKRYFRLTI